MTSGCTCVYIEIMNELCWIFGDYETMCVYIYILYIYIYYNYLILTMWMLHGFYLNNNMIII